MNISNIIEYWAIIVSLAAITGLLGYGVFIFAKRPTNEKLDKLRNWLIYATLEAEKELGSNTGQMKLRYCYDLFLIKFPALAKVISFETFSEFVDEALDRMKELLEVSKELQAYVDTNAE